MHCNVLFSAMYCFMYCNVLYCILHCTVLCTAMCCIVYCNAPYRVLQCAVLCTALHCIVHCNTLFCALHCTVLCTALHFIVYGNTLYCALHRSGLLQAGKALGMFSAGLQVWRHWTVVYCNENARLSCKIWRAVPPSWSLENCSQEPVFAGVHWKNPHIVTWHFTLCTLFSVQFTVYIVHYRLHTVYSTFYTLKSTLLTVQNHFYSCHSRNLLNMSGLVSSELIILKSLMQIDTIQQKCPDFS